MSTQLSVYHVMKQTYVEATDYDLTYKRMEVFTEPQGEPKRVEFFTAATPDKAWAHFDRTIAKVAPRALHNSDRTWFDCANAHTTHVYYLEWID